MQRDVFISYSRKNLARVTEIKNQIDRTCGTDCWIDLKGIESGSEMFLRDIVGGIDACKVFLFMLSRESMESEYALLELNYAKEQGKRVVLVNIDDCRMNGVFLFKYSLTDTIAWNNPPQREKLLRDIARWMDGNHTIDSQQNESLQVIKTRIESLDKEIGDLISFKDSNYRYGFKDKSGRVVIPCQWSNAMSFREGLAPVENGKVDLSSGVMPLRDYEGRYEWGGKWGFIDKTGRVVIPFVWKDVACFSEGVAPVCDDDDKWGFIDVSGKVVLPCKWLNTYGFHQGVAQVYDVDNKWKEIDRSGRVIREVI